MTYKSGAELYGSVKTNYYAQRPPKNRQTAIDGSHQVEKNIVSMSGTSKQLVGQVAAEIKSFRNQKAPEFLQQINPDGHSVDKEKWEVDITKVRKQADEALEYLQKMEDSLK